MPEASAIYALISSPLREERETITERQGPTADIPRHCWICSGGTTGIHYLQLDDTKRNVEGVFIQCACRVPVVQNLSRGVWLGSVLLGISAIGRDTHIDDLGAGGAPRSIADAVDETKGQIEARYDSYEL